MAHAAADTERESGGVLLGHRTRRRCYIVAVTAAAGQSQTEFRLDGARHTSLARQMARQFRHKPCLLGVWHSHVTGAAEFSGQDQRANRQLAAQLNGALSMLAVCSAAGAPPELTACWIAADGTASKVRTAVDRIPYRYQSKKGAYLWAEKNDAATAPTGKTEYAVRPARSKTTRSAPAASSGRAEKTE